MKRVAVVGLGHRAGKFIDDLLTRHRATAALAAFCDLSAIRMSAQNERLRSVHGVPAVPAYAPDRFEEMVRRERIDLVIVATIDSEHDGYIVRGLEAGCRVVTEKPMTVDARKCARILAAARGREDRLKVAFNYRWAPPNVTVRALLADGVVGTVRSVLLEWLLDVRHGADYFRRWHSDKQASGGLLVHKATHHFDLVNWWTDSIPERVYAAGGLKFYGQENAVARGDAALTRYDRYTGEPLAAGDPFRLDLQENARFKALYLDAERETGYIRDRNVFRPGITIEDDVSVVVRYRGGMTLSYVLNAFSPREGMRVMFNGDRGRLEYVLFAKSSGEAAENDEGAAAGKSEADGRVSVRVFPHFAPAYEVPVTVAGGGHWGGDPLLFAHLFSAEGWAEDDRWRCGAGPEQGAASMLVGVAGNQSLREDRPVAIDELLPLRPAARRLSELP